MRDCCPANQFDHGCEGIECRTASRRKEESQKLQRIIAKRNADTFMMMAVTAGMFLIVASSFVIFAVPESERLARVHQEQVASR